MAQLARYAHAALGLRMVNRLWLPAAQADCHCLARLARIRNSVWRCGRKRDFRSYPAGDIPESKLRFLPAIARRQLDEMPALPAEYPGLHPVIYSLNAPLLVASLGKENSWGPPTHMDLD